MTKLDAWRITPDIKLQLRKMAADGDTLTSAARKLGLYRNTIIRAAIRDGDDEWLMKTFPSGRRHSMNKRRSEAPSQQERVKRALTMAWR